MNLFDVLTALADLSMIGNNDSKEKRPKIYILFFLLIIPAVLWFVIELKSIRVLTSPILFTVVFVGAGILCSVGIIILIYRLGLIERLTMKDVLTIVFPVTLLTVSLASLINRT